MSQLNLRGVFLCLGVVLCCSLSHAQENLRRIKMNRENALQLSAEKGWRSVHRDAETSEFLLSIDQVVELSGWFHERQGRCGGFKDVTDGDLQIPVPPTKLRSGFRRAGLDPNLEPILQNVRSENLLATIQRLSSFFTRRYNSPTGKEAAEWMAQQLQLIGQGREDLTVELFDHSQRDSRWIMPSVIARLRGSVAPNESVIVGGHLDSINASSSRASAPGADDDASGVAAAFDAFRAIVASGVRPTRTLEFMAYSAEEVGLWGSQAIARKYRSENRAVRAVMQLDMVAYAGSGEKIYLLTDNVERNLNVRLQSMAENELGLQTAFTECGYGCSDHVSWTDAGYPAVIPFEADMGHDNPEIHTSQDTLANSLDMRHALKFAHLAATFYWDLGVQP